MAVQDYFVTIWGSKIHYTTEGRGKPILVLHGWPGSGGGFSESMEIFLKADPELEKLARKFFKKHKIIALDWPGFKKSQELKGEYNLDYLADFLNEFMKKTKIKGCDTLAVSMGGYISLTAQHKYGDLFGRMVIFGLAKDLSHVKFFNFSRLVMKLLGRRLTISLMNSIKNSDYVANRILSVLYPVSNKDTKQMQIYIEGVRRAPIRIHYEIIKQFLQKDFAANICHGINIPVTFVGAESDPIFPIDKIKEFASNIKNSKVIAVGGDDHGPFAHI
ncbi:MAG: alpha/beta hydrolase, partial [Candidatus Aenigmarchaeota archaeon]|nr:alpha/beta hydrolase [Candidatus Aenigmarchaeota archaeon]